MNDFKTPIGQCKFCGQTEYLVPYFGSIREICGCDAVSYVSDGTKLEEPPAKSSTVVELALTKVFL